LSFLVKYLHSFGRKLTLAYLAVFVFALIAFGFFISNHLADQSLERLKTSLMNQARLMTYVLLPVMSVDVKRSEVQEIAKQLGRSTGARVTVMAPHGFVLGDSERSWDDLLKMDNHIEREEMQTALKGGVGSSIRYSRTLRKEMLYVALPIRITEAPEVMGVIRVALPLIKVHQALALVKRPILMGSGVGIFFVVLVGVFLGRYVNRRVRTMARAAARYARGDLSQRISIETNDELDMLASSMNKMATALKERIAEIEEERAKAEAILDNMAEGAIAVDSDRRVQIVNPSAEKMFGISEKEARNKSLMEVVRAEKLHQMMEEVMLGKSVVNGEVELVHHANRVLRANAVGITQEGGHIRGVLVLHDVSEIRRLERMRQEFVANVSHELKTPLTSIKGFIETLLAGASRDPQRAERFLKLMQEDADRLKRLIDDILDLAGIESKDRPLRSSVLVLADEVRKVAEGLEQQLAEKQIDFKMELDVPPVVADPDKLRQVLINLLENGIKFNRERGQLKVSACALGAHVNVIVEDSGIGIPSEEVSRIFERFYRVDKARSRKMGGTGLGLSIVKHIIEAHGGEVSCESVLGHGSRFIFSLPIYRV